MNGESEVRLVDLASGSVLRRKALSNRDFGEGIVRVDSRCSFALLAFDSVQ